jgi:hypothetical protein
VTIRVKPEGLRRIQYESTFSREEYIHSVGISYYGLNMNKVPPCPNVKGLISGVEILVDVTHL